MITTCFIYLSNSLKNICYLLFNVLQSISINYIMVGSVCVQRIFLKQTVWKQALFGHWTQIYLCEVTFTNNYQAAEIAQLGER